MILSNKVKYFTAFIWVFLVSHSYPEISHYLCRATLCNAVLLHVTTKLNPQPASSSHPHPVAGTIPAPIYSSSSPSAALQRIKLEGAHTSPSAGDYADVRVL